MRVVNMQSPNGNPVPNQLVITDEGRGALGNFIKREVFQSYSTIIAERTVWKEETKIELDLEKWNHSATTSRYRNIFTNLTTAETKEAIKNGTIRLINLNKEKN